MATSKVEYGSDLQRRKWMMDGLLEQTDKSFWMPMVETSSKGVVYQAKNGSAKEGHTIVFDYSGKLAGRAIKGRDTATGKGEQKKRFSDKLTVNRYRMVVDNGDTFDGVDSGNLSLTQHSDSREKLSDLFMRWRDQALFDAAQGCVGTVPTHRIDIAKANFGYDALLDIEDKIKTSSNFTHGGIRKPLDPYKIKDGHNCWLFVVDTRMATIIKQDSKYQSLQFNADVRGAENRVFKGIIGKIGSLFILEAPTFFGDTNDASATFDLDTTSVEIAGLRRYDVTNSAWSGQAGYDPTSAQKSRGFLLGAGALQYAFGKMPDYKFNESPDFKITSESALETWCNFKKTLLITENSSDYNQAKVANIDYGIIAVDVA